MWKIRSTFLVLCLAALCAAADVTKAKTINSNSKQKDMKEKRDVVTPTPYSYEVPQKAFQAPINVQHSQTKYTQVVESQHAAPQKVAPLEYTKEEIPQTINEPSSQYHPTTFHSQSFGPDFESLYSQSLKSFDEHYGQNYGQNYGQHSFDSFNHVPVVHYNGEFDKINSGIVAIPGYAVKTAPAVSSYKSIPSYVYAAPASSYNYPSYSYPMQSYVHSYPQAIASPSHQHYTHSHGFTQSPSAIFIPQAISISSKAPSKVPDYATGTKGLSHYSTVAAAPVAPLNTHYVSHYSHSHPQTERPFKASPYLGDSYTEQSIHSAPSKNYLPAKEHHSYVSHQQAPQVEYQIQYVQQPSKSYLPAKEQQHQYYTQQQHVAPVANSYLPPHKVVVEQPKSSYLPPSFAAAAPSKNYLPAKVETPSNVYLPSKVERPTNVYLPSKVEKPSTSHLPPNNPFHSAHQQHYQQQPQQQQSQYQASHEYESAEYHQTVASHSGHK